MADYRSYGTSTHSADALVRLVGDRLGTVFAAHESYFRGVYYLAKGPERRIEIQPNAIPGDDGGDDLYDEERPEVQVLVLTRTPAPDPILERLLASIDGLVELAVPDPSGDQGRPQLDSSAGVS